MGQFATVGPQAPPQRVSPQAPATIWPKAPPMIAAEGTWTNSWAALGEPPGLTTNSSRLTTSRSSSCPAECVAPPSERLSASQASWLLQLPGFVVLAEFGVPCSGLVRFSEVIGHPGRPRVPNAGPSRGLSL